MKNGRSIYFKPDEDKLLREATSKLGIPVSTYIRELILNIDYIKEREKLELLYYTNEELLNALNHIGNNINQIAYQLNTGIIKDAQSIKNEFKSLRELLKEHKIIVKNNLQFKLLKKSKKQSEAVNE